MNDARHTPGPWKISKNLSPHCRYITDRNGHVVAEVDTALHAGNIDLLVAAPEMFALLQDVKAAVECGDAEGLYKQIDTLLARIEGGAK